MVTQTISSPISKTPPGPTGYPLVGCLPKMWQDPLQFLMNSALEYGDVVHLGAMGRQQVYLVSHPDDVKYVLQENSRNYNKGDNFKKAIELVFGQSIAVSEGDAWLRQRRLMQPALHRQRVESLVSSMTKVIDEMLGEWGTIKCDHKVEIFAEMMHLTQKLILKGLFSIDAGSKTLELMQAWDTVYNFFCDRQWALIKIPEQIPIPANQKFKQNLQILDRFVYRLIKERREAQKESGDLLSILLDAHDADSGQAISLREMRDEIITMFFGGFETAASTLAWVWYLLSKHPEVERKLNAEVTTVLESGSPTLENISHLNYTRMVIQESMRLYPAGWMFLRSNRNPDEIGGYEIPAKSLIMLSPFVTHRLPDFWDNPEGFDPERFTPERIAVRQRYAYYPFGGGVRQCMGEIFAMTEMQLIVAMVTQKFRLNIVPEYPVYREAKITLRPQKGVLMTLEPKFNS